MPAPCCSPTVPGGGQEDGAAWRSAATAPNRPRTAAGSGTNTDGLTNSRPRRNKQEFNTMAALPLIVFDVNETLLDLQTMEPIFERIFGERQAMRLWFANFIMYSAALTVADCYVPFTDIGAAVMKMLAEKQGI